MLLYQIPKDLLHIILDTDQLTQLDLKNLRMTAPCFTDLCATRLFHTFTLDLNDLACLLLAIHAHYIEDLDPDESKLEHPLPPLTKKYREILENITTEELLQAWALANRKKRIADFIKFSQHIRQLNIQGTGKSEPVYRDILLSIGLRSFFLLIPRLSSVWFKIWDHLFVDTAWTKILEDLCPPDVTTSATWQLWIRTMRTYNRIANDNPLQNFKLLRNVHALKLNIDSARGELSEKRTTEGMKGVASIIANSPTIRKVDVEFGDSGVHSFDDVMKYIPGYKLLPLEELTLYNFTCPLLPEHVKRLKNLRCLALHRSIASRSCRLGLSHPATHSLGQHCQWEEFEHNDIYLSSITSSHGICHKFIQYLGDHHLSGRLTTIHLTGLEAKSQDESDSLAIDFWNTLIIHAKYLKVLKIDPKYMGEWSWTAKSTMANTIQLLTNLIYLAVGAYVVNEVFYASEWNTKHPTEHIHELISSLWIHPTLETLELFEPLAVRDREVHPKRNLGWFDYNLSAAYDAAIDQAKGPGELVPDRRRCVSFTRSS